MKKNNSGFVLVYFDGTVDSVDMFVNDPDIQLNARVVLVEAWQFPIENSDKNVDEQIIDRLDVTAHSVIPGVGFTITCYCREGTTQGTYTIAWVWAESNISLQ